MKIDEKKLFGLEQYELGTCPLCKAPWKLEEELDIEHGEIIPDNGGIRPEATAALRYHAAYRLYQCRACEGEFYFIDIAVFENPAVSREWQDRFYRGGLGSREFVTGKTSRTLSVGTSYGSITEETPTMEGDLYRSITGPFVPDRKGFPDDEVRFSDWQWAKKFVALSVNCFLVKGDNLSDKIAELVDWLKTKQLI